MRLLAWWRGVAKKYRYLSIPFSIWDSYEDEILTKGWTKHKRDRKARVMIIKKEEVE